MNGKAMRVVILTTQTPHHAYFIREIGARHPNVLVLEETRAAMPPFPTFHPFEAERDAYERDSWFEGADPRLKDLAETETFASLNDETAVRRLAAHRPDVAMVFGTGRLSRAAIAACPDGMINLHGGDPQEYRGLDTHLWAIYHGDFEGLVTTLHRVAPDLDSGDIISRRPIALTRGLKLHQLRRLNTEVCVALVEKALVDFQNGALKSMPQTRKGRYYSFMPDVLKIVCVAKFHKYTDKL
jgi:methionyl-tRNA formyltransferase